MGFIDDVNKLLNEKPKEPKKSLKTMRFIDRDTLVTETLHKIINQIMIDDSFDAFVKTETQYDYFIDKPVGEMSYLFNNIFDCWYPKQKDVLYRLFYDNEQDIYIIAKHINSQIKNIRIYCNFCTHIDV